MEIIPKNIDSNFGRSNFLVSATRPTASKHGMSARVRFKAKMPKPSAVKTFEGIELIEMLLNQGNPNEAMKVFNRLKKQLEQK